MDSELMSQPTSIFPLLQGPAVLRLLVSPTSGVFGPFPGFFQGQIHILPPNILKSLNLTSALDLW